jgi:hypothetical protein
VKENFDLTVAVQKLGRGPWPDPGDAGITVRASPTSASRSGMSGRVANRFAPAVDPHHARTSHALRQILTSLRRSQISEAE